ncbi:MAG TPA: ATP-binding protein [Methylomirabilota bacterium]|nr:ATP-binding protein [Methylomirabilota bacterium]
MSNRSFERRIWFLALLVMAPGLAATSVLVLSGGISAGWSALVLVLAGCVSLGFAWRLVNAIRFPLRTLSNHISSLREGDYSLRMRGGRTGDALGELVLELNALAESLRGKRLEGVEAEALLRKVMEEIEVAIFTFDPDGRLQFVNRAGAQLLDRPVSEIPGKTAGEIGLAECLEGDAARLIESGFGGRMGRWAMRRTTFREGGRPHQLLVITDLSRALREEERQAWKRLIRVLGHELNNSLAPVRSIGASLERLMDREPRPEDWEKDVRDGLGVIRSRAEALSRFMEAYGRLARLPPPVKRAVNVRDWIRRVIRLEPRLPVTLGQGADAVLKADPDQMDALLINVVRNAVDAALGGRPSGGARVEVNWETRDNALLLRVSDNGPGVPESANLFVPFFTTKPEGSGIGLVLCRQIAEAHDGLLTLANQDRNSGAVVTLQLPLE